MGNDEPTVKLTGDWKAEMNLRTPKTLRVTGASQKARHSKDASRRRSKPKGEAPKDAKVIKELYFGDSRSVLGEVGRFGFVRTCGLWDGMPG